jgi:hypothetical protein
MKDDRDLDAAFYLGAPKNERELERSAHAARTGETDPGQGQESRTGSTAQKTDASLRYGIVEEADDDLGEGLYERRAA